MLVDCIARRTIPSGRSRRKLSAYRRSELFDKRRKLMAGWGTFCMTPAEGEDRSNRRGTTG
jgi:hypothetical protein